MKDVSGKLIEVGQKLRRVVDGRATKAGHEYTAIMYEWNDMEQLTADAGFIKELLDDERAKEFEIV